MSHTMRLSCIGRANIGSSLLLAPNKRQGKSISFPGGGTLSLRCSASNSKDEDSDVKKIPGLTKYTAKVLLKAWKQANVADDPKALKRMLKKRGAEQSVVILRQLMIDGGASLVAWYSAGQLSASHVSISAEFLLYALALYLTMNATVDIAELITVGITTRKYSNQSSVILRAVQEMAGDEQFGVQLVDKARRAINTVEVLKTLDSILEALRQGVYASGSGGSNAGDGMDFFKDLGAYLVLARAQEAGFSLDSYGIDQKILSEIAGEFALADTDDDGFVDSTEFRALAMRKKRSAPMTLDEAEAALAMLDTNGDGVIDFQEFVSWFVENESKKGE